MERFRVRKLGSVLVAIALAGCAGGSSLTPQASRAVSTASHTVASSSVKACTPVTDSRGFSFSAARVGGGDHLDIEASAYAGCDVGIYIGSAGSNKLDHTIVGGAFKVGIYVDGGGDAKLDHTSICVTGAGDDGSCSTGTNGSGATGLLVVNTPKITVDHTSIDGYTAGVATNPCPNSANDISIDHTMIGDSSFPWSFQGGKIKTNHSTPAPPPGGSCAGSGVGFGTTPLSVTPNTLYCSTQRGAPAACLNLGISTALISGGTPPYSFTACGASAVPGSLSLACSVADPNAPSCTDTSSGAVVHVVLANSQITATQSGALGTTGNACTIMLSDSGGQTVPFSIVFAYVGST